jgi:ketosteroid isomerase-like protein
MRFVALVFTLVLATAGALAAPADDLRQIEKSWAAAVVKSDFAALDGLLGERLVYAHASGVVETKGEYLAKLKSGAQKYDSIEHAAVKVEVYGAAAVVHATVRMRGATKGEPFDNRLMMLHLWVKDAGRWRLAAHQTARLP